MDLLQYELPWSNWKIESLIGLGSYSAVYKAVDDETSKDPEAIKIIQSSFKDNREYIEFLGTVAANNNCYIVNIHDYATRILPGKSSNQPDKSLIYIREELLESADNYLKTIALDEKTITSIGIDVCTALETLEYCNIVHNRVVSSNIFVTQNGNKKSFKLSCDTTSLQRSFSSRLLKSADTFYTPFYSAPELFNKKTADHRADIYSLGITLYQYLNNGQFPFIPSDSPTRYSILEDAENIRLNNEEPIPKPANASSGLSKIILKAISFNPDDRFQSAAEFKKALNDYLNPVQKTKHQNKEDFPKLPWPNWHITKRIQTGGLATVYEAKQKKSSSRIRRSAVKIVNIPASDEDLYSIRSFAEGSLEDKNQYLNHRFEAAKEEIDVLETFKTNPNIVHLEDSECASEYDGNEGITRHTIYMRFELLQSIKEYFKNKMNESQVIQMGIQICSALEQMESYRTQNGERIYHCDISPDNILVSVSTNGQVYFKLSGFGLVRKITESFDTDMINAGTPSFVAPEIRLKRKPSPSIDIYSLGMVIYYCLNNSTLPFESTLDSLEESERRRLSGKEQISPPIQASEELSDVILKAIAYNPEDRYKSANAFKEALQEVLKPKKAFPKLPWPNWRIIKRIGIGGYGSVYEAELKKSNSNAMHSAVKIVKIPSSDADLETMKMQAGESIDKTSAYINQNYEAAMKEINALLTFKNHQNIVHLEDWGEVLEYDTEEEIPRYTIYMRLELLQSIRKYFKDRLDENQVIQMGIQICSALEQLEFYGKERQEMVFHRDVTPDNILVSVSTNGQETFKLNDFGIIREVKESMNTRITFIGKAFYVAPEIKKNMKPNPTIDTYSLGMSMYYYLNDKKLPFEETSRSRGDAEEKRLNGEEPIPAPKLASERLGKIVLKAIAFNPEDRYQSASEMKKALLEFQRSA